MRRGVVLVAVVLAALPLTAAPAAAHAERDATFPTGAGGVPEYRFEGPTLVVCKPDTAQRLAVLPEALRIRNAALLADCEHEHLNAAIAAVEEQGTRILVLPGIYREEPYTLDAIPPECQGVGTVPQPEDQIGAIPLPLATEMDDPGQDEGSNDRASLVLTYEEQVACPYLQNLIPIFGDSNGDGICDNALCDLQIEGTGARPEDVIVDGDYSVLNGIRGDRADGLYLRNLTVQRFEFNAVYLLETDGFAFDEVVTRWNDEYGFLSFAVDHGLYQNCEGYTNGDSALYPGSASDLNQEAGLFDDDEGLRFATEIRGCRGHHNTLGYSGTAGNSVHTHHNEFDHNIVGFATDSLFPGHPGLPQDHAFVHDNLIHANNSNYYRFVQDGESCTGPFGERDYDEGVVCPVVPLPVGSGIVVAGGNHNLIEDNRIHDNWREGVKLFFVPAILRGEDDPALQFDTSNFNTVRDNVVGDAPDGHLQPNGVDLWWDGEGEGNCWAGNASSAGPASTSIGGAALPLPGCEARPPFTPGPAIAINAACATYSRDTQPAPTGCDWFDTPAPPADRQPEAPTLERLAGADRVATAISASTDAFPGRAQAVVIARADAFPDALAGAPLAEHVRGPLLVTGSDRLDPRVAAELTRLGATRAYLLGGTAALAEQVAADLAALGVTDVQRVAGADRFATAALVARLVGGTNAYLVNGTAFADAVAASAIAAHQGRPLLLTATAEVPAATQAYLDEGLVTSLQLVGGSAVIAEGVAQTLAEEIRDVSRIAGADRYETSLLLAEAGVLAGQDPTQLSLATGTDWPDALAAGPAAAVDEGVVLLVPAEVTADAPAARWLEQHAAILEDVRVLGGTAAVPAGVDQAVADLTGAVAGDAEGPRSHGVLVTAGSLALLPGAPAGYEDLAGTAVMRRTLHGSTDVEVLAHGLPAGVAAPTHVHEGTCATGGGEHFQFDPAGDPHPLPRSPGRGIEGPAGGQTAPSGEWSSVGEIHPRFVTDASGVGRGTATAWAVAGPTARSVMIHTPDGTPVACADLVGSEVPPGEETQPNHVAFMAPPTAGLLPDEAVSLLAVGLVGLALSVALRRRRVLLPARAATG